MKSVLACLPSVLLLAICAPVLASNYPADYTHQNIRVLQDGPALFAAATSGCNSTGRLVIGYKDRGFLAQFSPRAIDAVIQGGCNTTWGFQTRQSVIRLEREMHGAGFIAGNINPWDLMPGCDYGSDFEFQIAFSDGKGNWDSKFGNNFRFSMRDVFARGGLFKTGQSSCDLITYNAWDFIVGEMRN